MVQKRHRPSPFPVVRGLMPANKLPLSFLTIVSFLQLAFHTFSDLFSLVNSFYGLNNNKKK